MPRIADFVVVQDHGVTIPHDGINDWHFSPFNAPGATSEDAVLSFRVTSSGSPQVTVRFNERNLVTNQQLGAGRERSWHETITQAPVKTTENLLDIIVQGNGSVTVSDIVLHYHARV